MADMRDFLARRKAKADPPKAPEAAPAPEAKPKRVKPPKPEAAPSGVITYACGHKVGVAHFQGQACPGCANDRRAARDARKTQKAAAKAIAAGQPDPRRLPDKAFFSLRYDAAAVRWFGVLGLPHGENGGECRFFEADASGVTKVLGKLDRLYREWLAAQEGHADAAP